MMSTPDGPDHPDQQCASCYSRCTTVHVTQTYGLPPKPIYTCVDREMCRTIMALEHLAQQTRSA
jgi:hypothetical protein